MADLHTKMEIKENFLGEATHLVALGSEGEGMVAHAGGPTQVPQHHYPNPHSLFLSEMIIIVL